MIHYPSSQLVFKTPKFDYRVIQLSLGQSGYSGYQCCISYNNSHAQRLFRNLKLQFAVGIPNIVVFTIDEGLWIVSLLHRKMLKEFMDEAERIIKSYAGDEGRNEGKWRMEDV
ncbi:hypothetical protein ASD40_14710 [Paenibacillus sp. Root444D2]|nr:hypothetical protein [Paenibacillus sp. Root444D2]KQX46551.1 hypothetical protein ASD40_14710 [Paenibacillus sp. Root444D2]